MRAVTTILTTSPVDRAIQPYCEPVPGDPFAEGSTWADDQRSLDPTTAGWHFVDFPRILGVNTAGWARYCRHGNCVIDAIAAQFSVLKSSAVPAKRADALRFITHFVGDLHQPLHAITNGDRGGNCLPVTYLGETPQEDDKGNFSPNLHSVWDTRTIRTLMTREHLADARALAEYIEHFAGPGVSRAVPGSGVAPLVGSGVSRTLPAVTAAAPTPARVASWARESNALARRVAYGRLAIPVPLEPAAAFSIATCTTNRDIGHRLMNLHERVDPEYEAASVPVIIGQLRQAGIRLAEVLAAAFPSQ
jgi:hypothetical protein